MFLIISIVIFDQLSPSEDSLLFSKYFNIVKNMYDKIRTPIMYNKISTPNF